RLSNILIFSGGALFNALSTVAVIYLVENNLLQPCMFTYQFTNFSMYYILFALLPMSYPGGNYSDGKLILDLIRNQKHISEKTYRIHWDNDKSQWCVLDHKGKLVQAFQDEGKAMAKAQEVAQNNRPSRLINGKSGEEKEVRNNPIIPL